MPIRFPKFYIFRHKGPEFYRMRCTRCDFTRAYELAKDYTVIQAPECERSSEPEVVEELPAVCPKCGSRLKKEKLPVKLRY